jgi:aspartate/methionine/tyrosine aminotransferase
MARRPELSQAARALRESIFARLAGRLAHHGADGVPLHLGDTYVAPPPALRLETDDPALYRYGAPAGEASLLAALVDKLRARNHLVWVEPANVQITAGATQALSAAVRAIVDPGDEVIVPTPHWPLIRGIITNAGGVPVEVPLTQQLYDDSSLDPAALLAPAITEKTVALYLTTPNNPDGKVLSQGALTKLGALAEAHDLWVIADEVYEDLVYDGEHVSIASLPGMAGRTLTTFSLSKSFALAGYRLGYVVAERAPLAAIRKIVNHTVYNVPDVLQRAAARLLTDPATASWRAATQASYRAARDRASQLLIAPHSLPDGATYLFLDLARYLQPNEESLWPLVERLIDAGVSISPGEQFGRGFERHARICFTAVPESRLLVGLSRIEQVLAKA